MMRLVVLSALLIAVTVYAGYTYLDRDYLDSEKLMQMTGLAPVLIDDGADLLPQDGREYIREYHQMLLQRFDIDYRIITANNLPDINSYAWEEFNGRKVGSDSLQGRGMLLVIDPARDQLRIEVSANLESVYPDAFVAYLENRQMVPFFNRGRVAEGIFATSELMRIRAIQAQQGMEFDPASIQTSIGGGASAEAGINAGRDTNFVDGKPDVLAGDSPEETLRRFFASMDQRNGRWDLDIFTPASRQHMKKRINSAAQMDNTVKQYRLCIVEHVTYNKANTRAVLAYRLSNRGCDPFFFEKGPDGKWRLDLKTLGTALGHTFGNIWYIDYRRYEMSGIARYEFGLRHFNFRRPGGEQFEHQGIPYYQKYGMYMSYITEGTVIRSFPVADGFMEQQGFKVGDVILQWESITYPHQASLSYRMEHVRPGLDIYTRVRRGDFYFEKTFKAPPYPRNGEYRFGITYHSPGTKLPQIHYVEPGELADKLGIQAGDIIASWQGKKEADMRYIWRVYKALEKGDRLSAQVYRGDELISLATTVGSKRKMGKVQ